MKRENGNEIHLLYAEYEYSILYTDTCFTDFTYKNDLKRQKKVTLVDWIWNSERVAKRTYIFFYGMTHLQFGFVRYVICAILYHNILTEKGENNVKRITDAIFLGISPYYF